MSDCKFSVKPRNPLAIKFPKEKKEKKRKRFIQVEHFIKWSFSIKILPFWVEIFIENPEGSRPFFKMWNLSLPSFILFFFLCYLSSLQCCQLSVVGCRLTVIGCGRGKLEEMCAVNVGSSIFCESCNLIFHDL